MAMRKKFEDENIPPEHLDTSKWPMAFVSDDQKELFDRRKEAVDLYFRGTSVRQIKKATGMDSKDLYRFIERCLTVDENGEVWGYRALIPNKRLKEYQRTKRIDEAGVKLTGAFETLLDAFPAIRELIVNLFLGRCNKEAQEPVIQIRYIWKRFLDACRAAKLTAKHYPFNTKDRGRRSLERYLKDLEKQRAEEAAKRYSEDAARRLKNNGQGINETNRVYHTVEFDGHRIDGMFAFIFKTMAGDSIIKVLERLWLLVIIDRATRVILGYYISLSKEYSAADVLRCCSNAIMPWVPKQLAIPGLKYPEQGGFPSNVFPNTAWAAWEELKYDNGKANLANVVKDRLTRIMGCSVNPGPVKAPERRPIIERWFGLLEENGFHRLPNTTGNCPGDPRRQDPEGAAIKYWMTLEELYEITDVLIAEYNGTPHSGLGYLTPLEAFSQRVNPLYLNIIPEEKRRELKFLTLIAKRTIRGSIKTGKRPHINYEGVVYRNEVLSASQSLIGTELSLVVDVEDLRVIEAFLPDGSSIGLLEASGKWGIVPHSLKTRKEINELRNRKIIHFTDYDNAIDVYREYLTNKAADKKYASNLLARLEKELSIDDGLSDNKGYSSIEESDVLESVVELQSEEIITPICKKSKVVNIKTVVY